MDYSKIFKANPYHDQRGRFSSAQKTPVEKHPSASPFLRAASRGFLYVPPGQGGSIDARVEWES